MHSEIYLAHRINYQETKSGLEEWKLYKVCNCALKLSFASSLNNATASDSMQGTILLPKGDYEVACDDLVYFEKPKKIGENYSMIIDKIEVIPQSKYSKYSARLTCK